MKHSQLFCLKLLFFLEIDEYIYELVNDGNYKELEGYIINGFQDLAAILRNYSRDEEAEAKQLDDFINQTILQLEVRFGMCFGAFDHILRLLSN